MWDDWICIVGGFDRRKSVGVEFSRLLSCKGAAGLYREIGRYRIRLL